MPLIPLKITGTASYLPEKILTNDDLAKFLDTSDEWIRTRTGIRTRHILSREEIPATMGIRAAEQALARAQRAPQDVDVLLVATNVPEEPIPGTAPHIALGLGMERGRLPISPRAAPVSFTLWPWPGPCSIRGWLKSHWLWEQKLFPGLSIGRIGQPVYFLEMEQEQLSWNIRMGLEESSAWPSAGTPQNLDFYGSKPAG
jgi:hypothetical protein